MRLSSKNKSRQNYRWNPWRPAKYLPKRHHLVWKKLNKWTWTSEHHTVSTLLFASDNVSLPKFAKTNSTNSDYQTSSCANNNHYVGKLLTQKCSNDDTGEKFSGYCVVFVAQNDCSPTLGLFSIRKMYCCHQTPDPKVVSGISKCGRYHRLRGGRFAGDNHLQGLVSDAGMWAPLNSARHIDTPSMCATHTSCGVSKSHPVQGSALLERQPHVKSQ